MLLFIYALEHTGGNGDLSQIGTIWKERRYQALILKLTLKTSEGVPT